MTTGTKKDKELIRDCHSHKIPLPPEQVEIYLSKDRQSIIASFFEYPKGCMHWDRFNLSYLSDNLISTRDCEHFGVFRLVEG
jgi:hypothetical protein